MNPNSPDEIGVLNHRDRIRQATADAILAAAESVFAEQGLHGARMNDIAAQAGMAVGTLYNHFQDRDTLLSALLARRRQEILELIDAVLDAPGLDFRERLTDLLLKLFAYFDEHQPFFTVYTEQDVKGDHTTIMRELYARMEKLVKRGVREKMVRAEGAELYPAVLVGLMRAAKIRQQMTGKRLGDGEAAELVRFFLQGVMGR
jgi:AcrR family transcriptional regulator